MLYSAWTGVQQLARHRTGSPMGAPVGADEAVGRRGSRGWSVTVNWLSEKANWSTM